MTTNHLFFSIFTPLKISQNAWESVKKPSHSVGNLDALKGENLHWKIAITWPHPKKIASKSFREIFHRTKEVSKVINDESFYIFIFRIDKAKKCLYLIWRVKVWTRACVNEMFWFSVVKSRCGHIERNKV